MRPSALATFTFLAVSLLSLSAQPCLGQTTVDPARSLNYITEQYRPFNYEEQGELKGLSVELLKLMWKEMKVPEQVITLMPWSRGYESAKSDPNIVLFTTLRSPEREGLFKWVGPIHSTRTVFIARKDSPITMESLDDARGLSIGVVKNYASAITLMQYKRVFKIDTLSTMDMAVRKLASDRVELIALELSTFLKIIEEMNLPADDFKIVWTLAESDSYYAFSISTPDEQVERFQKALDTVKKTPAYPALVRTFFQ